MLFVRALLAFALATAIVAPAAEARSLYVANELTQSVSVIDTRTDTVSGALKTEYSPTRVGVTPDGSKLVVPFSGFSGVGVLGAVTGTQLAPTIKTEQSPYGPAMSPDGTRAYLASFFGNQVITLDLSTLSVLGSPFTSTENPFDIVISPDGARLYVTATESDYLDVYDTRTGAKIVGILVGDGPRGLAISPSGRWVYVANEGSGSVAVVETATNRIIGSPIPIGAGADEVAVSPTGAWIYVGNSSDKTVTIVDGLSKVVAGAPISMAEAPRAITFTPDGSKAYVGLADATVVPIDVATRTPGAPIQVAGEVGGLAMAPAQPPQAAISGVVENGVAKLSAAGSTDPDSPIADYRWSMSGGSSTGLETTRKLSFGPHHAIVVLTDAEGCSMQFVTDGQTAYCNGSTVARATIAIQTIKIVKVKRKPRKGTATLAVKVSGAGTLKLRGKQLIKAAKTAKKAKTLVLKVKAKRKGRRKLARSGVARLGAELRFLPDDGLTVTKTTKLKLVKRTG